MMSAPQEVGLQCLHRRQRQLVLPVLAYADPDAAISWLCRVFRFTEESRMVGRDGTVAIADLRTSAGGSLMIGGIPPRVKARLGPLLDQPRADDEVIWPDALTVILPDVDAQFEHVRREGAAIRSELTDQPWGLRDFETLDLAGRPWNFSQHLRNVRPQDWGATPSGAD
jgi:uncharacterized glyoxalase superfamily protein PhnB